MLALNMRQLKHKTLTRMGVAQSLSDPTFEALSLSFQRIEEALPHVYHHILTSLTSCHAFCHTLSTTFGRIPVRDGRGDSEDSFSRTMQLVREQADALEQAVTLTVLAPLQGIIQRCAVLRAQLHEREKFVVNYDLTKLEYMTAAATDLLKAQKQSRMEQAWQEYQSFTQRIVQEILRLDIEHKSVRDEALQAMKLHVAKFFLGSQKLLWASLDVPPPTSDPFADTDDSEAEDRPSSLVSAHDTLSPPALPLARDSRYELSKRFSLIDDDGALSPRQRLRLQTSDDDDDHRMPFVSSVVSTPMAALPISPKRSPVASSTPAPRQSWFVDFLWSKDEAATTSPVTSPRPTKPSSRKNRMLLAPREWAAVEAVLWELDDQAAPHIDLDPSPSARRAVTPVDESSVGRRVLLDMPLLTAITSHLDVVSLSHVGQVCRAMRRQIVGSTALWHRVIRLGGVPASIRCAFWVWFQFDRQQASPFRAHDQYDLLLVQAAQLVRMNSVVVCGDEDDKHESDDKQILAWFNDIDVDVGRTCHKTLFTKDVAEEWDLVQIPETDVAAMVEQALLLETSPQHAAEPTEEEKAAAQATMRRLLRAYVMHNPRIGYCQGMNFIVRLLMDNQRDEAAIFWTFVSLCDGASPSLFEPGFHTLQSLFAKLEVLIQQQIPEAHVHLKAQGVHVSMFAARWFLTLFTSLETFGPTLVLRLLDLYHVDRHRILCGIALVVLEELKDLILESEFESILAILQYPRHYMPEPDFTKRKELMQHALVVSITRILLI
ncbi:Aste57867_12934 [Aphanomyces stellatus]|uniref:Aste57867_12934 protein n=1 Tax=Aphanomyces stellatus TaxID=120398 RepID=A0A485KXJ5_9STRA|nr:hypothetical protein As57867_012886 [Aphanomyces stellatus]VFT89780.1 Aste57867_12934 [Aphanomyces stellatus]